MSASNKKHMRFFLAGAVTMIAAGGIAVAPIVYGAEAAPIPEVFQPGGAGAEIVTFLPWLFKFLLAAATVSAVLVITFAGFQWMVGAVSPPQIADAKSRIQAALIGLAIAFLSFLILQTINPALVNLQLP